MLRHRSPSSRADRVQSHGTRGSVRALINGDVESRVVGHVTVLEPAAGSRAAGHVATLEPAARSRVTGHTTVS
jgi:hypothetical protein